MKKTIKIAGMVLAGAVLASCGTQRSVQRTQAEKVSDGNSFAFALYNNVERLSDDDANVLVSPYSASVALGMLREGAAGKTEEEIAAALGDFDWSKEPEEDEDVQINSASSAWVNINYELDQDYRQLLSSKADALASNLDFSDPASTEVVNSWCSDNTDGKISGIVDHFNPQDVLLLVNALHFKAGWMSPFTRTQEAVFHGTSGDGKVTFMYRNKYSSYADDGHAEMISLEFGTGVYKMHFILPGKDFVLSESSFRNLLSNMEIKKVDLELPQFKVEVSMSLNDALENLGIKKIFTSSADLSGIGKGSLVVSDVAQKTYIDVNKDGCEAAAVTSVTVGLTSFRPEPSIEMKVDRPFYYLITDKDARTILFIGKTNNLE